MKFSKNGKYLASAGQDAAVRVWEVCLNRGEARAESESEHSVSEAGAHAVAHTGIWWDLHHGLCCLSWVLRAASCDTPLTASPIAVRAGCTLVCFSCNGALSSLSWGLGTHRAGNRSPDFPSVVTSKA